MAESSRNGEIRSDEATLDHPILIPHQTSDSSLTRERAAYVVAKFDNGYEILITFNPDKLLRDPGLDTLLDLDGEALVIDPAGQYWVHFRAKRVPRTPKKPHGLEYAMTLHGPDGKRLIGFDNAHPIRRTAGPSGRKRGQHDHRHRHRSTRPYAYKDAATLLADFWKEVEAMLKERGVLF